MNKINLTKDLRADPELDQSALSADEHETEVGQSERSDEQGPAKGKDQVALRGDLIELHKRMVDMFKTLSTGLAAISTEKAEKDRAVLSARIDEMERSLNTMEGMVRIEMVPQFRAVLNEALEERDISTGSRLGHRIITTGLVAAGIVAGVIWSEEIASHWGSLIEYTRNFLTLN